MATKKALRRERNDDEALRKGRNSAPPAQRKTPKGDLPPNENIQKDADEVYGDTELPRRNTNR